MSSPRPFAAGQVVHSRYEVERLLGQGAFGATYLVRDRERFGATCALKELRPHDPTSLDKARELFEREARVLLAIEHPQIPALHAYFEEDGSYFLVQALVEGRALDTVMRETGTMPEPAVRQMVVEVLGVLDYLHTRTPPVLHRDIKPSNLIRDKNGRVCVIDFGAVREALNATALESGVTMIGTPGYAPLEQAIGQPVPASDIHALGMTALYMLTGKGPAEWRDRVTAEPTILGRSGASADFERVLARMVADLPERYQKAAEVSGELRGGATRARTARPSAPTEISAATIVDKVDPPAPPPRAVEPARPKRRNVQRGLIIGGTVAALAAFGVFVATRDDTAGNSTTSTATPPPVAEQKTTGTPPVAEVLDNESTLRTASGVTIAVKHPTAWQPVSQTSDGYIALQDQKTNGVFITGLDGSPDQPQTFARQIALRVSAKHGRIDLRDAGSFDAAGSFWRFPLNVNRASAPETGLLVVEVPPPSQTGSTLYRWWALIGQTDGNIPTALAMAGSLSTRAAADR